MNSGNIVGIIGIAAGLAGLMLLILAVVNPGEQENLERPSTTLPPKATSSRTRTYRGICGVCGKEVPFREALTHGRMLHSEALQQLQRADQDFGRRFLTIILPATAVMIVAVSTLSFVYNVQTPGWYARLLAGWFASFPAGFGYAWMRTRAEFELPGNRLYQCRICEVPIPWKDMQVHLAAEHPRELWYLRISRIGVLGLLFGVFFPYISLSALVLGLLPFAPLEILWLFGPLLAGIGFVAVMAILVDPHHRAKARAAWRTTHWGIQADPK